MRRLCYLIATLVLVAVTAQAVQVTTADGNGADTYLSNDSQHSGNYNDGARGDVGIRQAWDSRTRIGYLKFDLSDVSGDLSGTTLGIDLIGTKRARTWTIFELADGNDGWGEMTVCYNNAPGFISPQPDGEYVIDYNLLTAVATMNVDGTDPNIYWSTAFTPTPGTDNLLTLAIVYDTTSTDTNPEWYFKSKENDSLPMAPTLDMPNAVPEPTTIALLAFGAKALIRRRKR